MRKTSGNITAFLVAALIVVLWALGVDASGSGPSASITIHKLETDTSRKLNQIQDGEKITSPDGYEVYEGDSGIRLGDLKGINGISFTVTRVQDYLEDIESALPYRGEGEYQKTLTTQSRGRERGIAYFESLPYGTYLIEEGRSADYEGDTMRFLLQVPMTSPQGDHLIHDIHIYPKNVKRSSLTEEVAAFSPQTPVKVTWRFNWELPAGIDRAEEFVLTSPLDERLTLQPGATAVAVRFSNRAGASRKLSTRYYEVDYDKQERIVTITIDDSAAFDELAKAYLPEKGAKPPTLHVEMTTNIAPDARGTIYNTGDLNFKYGDGVHLDLVPERDPSIYIGDIGGLLIYKYDGDTGAPLSGAQFSLFASKEDALAGTNPIQNPRGSGGAWPPTGTDGYALLEGLAYENEGTSYWLVETVAPVVAGSDPPLRFNLLPAPVEVTVNASSHSKGYQVEVENWIGNMAGDILPETGARVPDGGGGGTTPWRLGGIILLMVGAILAACRCNSRDSRQE